MAASTFDAMVLRGASDPAALPPSPEVVPTSPGAPPANELPLPSDGESVAFAQPEQLNAMSITAAIGLDTKTPNFRRPGRKTLYAIASANAPNDGQISHCGTYCNIFSAHRCHCAYQLEYEQNMSRCPSLTFDSLNRPQISQIPPASTRIRRQRPPEFTVSSS